MQGHGPQVCRCPVVQFSNFPISLRYHWRQTQLHQLILGLWPGGGGGVAFVSGLNCTKIVWRLQELRVKGASSAFVWCRVARARLVKGRSPCVTRRLLQLQAVGDTPPSQKTKLICLGASMLRGSGERPGGPPTGCWAPLKSTVAQHVGYITAIFRGALAASVPWCTPRAGQIRSISAWCQVAVLSGCNHKKVAGWAHSAMQRAYAVTPLALEKTAGDIHQQINFFRQSGAALPLQNLVSDSADTHCVSDPLPQPMWDHRSTGQL